MSGLLTELERNKTELRSDWNQPFLSSINMYLNMSFIKQLSRQLNILELQVTIIKQQNSQNSLKEKTILDQIGADSGSD